MCLFVRLLFWQPAPTQERSRALRADRRMWISQKPSREPIGTCVWLIALPRKCETKKVRGLDLACFRWNLFLFVRCPYLARALISHQPLDELLDLPVPVLLGVLGTSIGVKGASLANSPLEHLRLAVDRGLVSGPLIPGGERFLSRPLQNFQMPCPRREGAGVHVPWTLLLP